MHTSPHSTQQTSNEIHRKSFFSERYLGQPLLNTPDDLRIGFGLDLLWPVVDTIG